MKSISFKDKIEKEIVETIQSNDEVHDAINNLVKDRFVEKETFDQRFDRILEEMRAEREEAAKDRVANARKWDESRKQWEKNDLRWEKNQRTIDDVLSKIKIVEINDKELKDLFTQTVGSIGSRWGTRSEQSFRNALKGILEETTHYTVLNVIEDDKDGVVFGWPAQVELDIVVTNGKFFIIEIKSSISTGDVATFVKKAKFYQEKHNKKANALVIISPMIDEKAREFIYDLGIIAYSYASDVDPILLD